MTTPDANRVAFVQQPFRYTDHAKDPAILARNPDALIVRLDTNLSYDAAVIRAQDELNAAKNARVFDVEVHAIIHFDDFVGGPPSFSFTSERDQCFNREMRVVAFSCDINTMTTTLRLRG